MKTVKLDNKSQVILAITDEDNEYTANDLAELGEDIETLLDKPVKKSNKKERKIYETEVLNRMKLYNKLCDHQSYNLNYFK